MPAGVLRVLRPGWFATVWCVLGASHVFAQDTDEVNPRWSASVVAQLFREACVVHEGQSTATIDWALAQGFAPVDAYQGSQEGLLAGQPGTVLAAPDSDGRVLLAAALGGACSVWADKVPGPPLRLAFAAMVGELSAKSAKLQSQLDRSIERSGAWRSQVQWRYRRVGGSQDFALSAVTTLNAQAGTQVLHMQPQPSAVNHTPDGQSTR